MTINEWFGLTYASYLCIPRVLLESAPRELQQQLVNALNAIEDFYSPGHAPVAGAYFVQLRDERGRFIHDPLRDYRHKLVTPQQLHAMCEAVN